jgi:biotin-(acetyl-CoA carboxylase) ligase
LDSTSTLLKQRAEAGAAEGLAIQALRQNAGRGRQGRARR